MAQESPLLSPPHTSPVSYKRSITLSLSPSVPENDPSSTINPALDETQLSPDQSPKKPRPSSDKYPLTDSEFDDKGSSQKLILGQIYGVLDEVEGANNEVSGDNDEVSGNNDVSGLDLVKNEDDVVGFPNEVSGVYTEEVESGFNWVSGLHLVKNEDIGVGFPNEVSRVYNEGGFNGFSGLELVKTDDFLNGVSGLELIKNCDEISLGFDGEMLKNDRDMNFNRKCVVSVMGRANSSLKSISKKLASPLTMELIDETVLIGISGFGRTGREKRGSNGVGVAGNSNGGTRKMKYSRKELDKLRFVNVQAQKKFWQDVYNGFADNVRKEYVELGSFSQYKQIGSYNCYNGMRNYQGIHGMAAGRGRCTYPNVYVYRRNGIINC